MASNFVGLDKAAEMLGMSPDDVVEARSQGELRGFRDGASWKFKTDDVQRFAEERGITLGGKAGGAAPAKPKASDLDNLSFDDDLDNLISVTEEAPQEGADASSILVSEEELGHSEESTSSTIIGRGKLVPADSDLKLATEGSAIELDTPTPSNFLGGGSDKKIADDSDLNLMLEANAESDVKLVASGGSDSELAVSADSELSIGDKPKPAPKPPARPANSDMALKRGSATNSDLVLSGGSKSGGSDALSLGDDDELKLSDDDDLVLGSGMGSDVTLSSDSGINLKKPSDSGLSLEEEPLDLGGSAISNLELPEDDAIAVEEPADADAATQLRQDEEFSLGPSDDFGEDDSGSQVIALEDSEAFDSDAATMLQQGGLMVEEAGAEAGGADAAAAGGFGGFDAFGAAPAMGAAAMTGGAMPSAMPAGMGGMGPSSMPEAPYSIWNILGLLCVMLVMSLSLMLTVDVIRNMWGWNDGTTAMGTSLMDSLVQTFGFNNK